MKKFFGMLTIAALVVATAVGGMSVGAASSKTIDRDAALGNANYRTYHQGHMSGLSTSGLTDEEYKAERESYRAERRTQYEKDLKQEVADGTLTQAEADQYLADFDNMADYCGSHMMNGSHHSGGRMSGRRGGGHCH